MSATHPTPILPAALGRVVRNLSFAETPAPHLAAKAKPELSLLPSQPHPLAQTQPATIRVVVRVRPLTAQERSVDPKSCLLHTDHPRTLEVRICNPLAHRPNRRAAGKASFRFAAVLQHDATQSTVFESTALPLVDRLFQGLNAVIFAYGVTGSGKTWTIAGNHQNPGVLPRSLDVIVNSIAKSKGQGLRQDSTVTDGVALLTEGSCANRRRRHKAAEKVHDGNYIPVDGSVDYSIYASYIEVYNEQVYDLFESIPESSDRPDVKSEPGFPEESASESHRTHRRRVLKLREDGTGQVYAEGQTECEIKSGADIDRLLEFGHRNRSVAHTFANEHSSRSHAIFIISLKQSRTIEQPAGPPKVFRTSSSLHIVDLAGTERNSKTNNTKRSKEASNINLSLMNLSRCFEVLRKNQRLQRKDPTKPPDNVPFRNSRLTRLLQHSLTAGSAVMIATVSPFARSADETIKSLQGGAVVQEVRMASPEIPKRVLADRTNTINTTSSGIAVDPRKTRATRSRGVQKRLPRKEEAKTGALQQENMSLRAENEKLKNLAQALRRENVHLKSEKEELEIDLSAANTEADELFQENDRLRDQVAVGQAQIRWIESETREEVSKEAERVIQDIQEDCNRQITAAQEKNEDLRRKEVLMSAQDRREYVAAMARRLSRASIAVVDEILPTIGSLDDAEDENKDDSEDYVSDYDDYEEEEDE